MTTQFCFHGIAEVNVQDQLRGVEGVAAFVGDFELHDGLLVFKTGICSRNRSTVDGHHCCCYGMVAMSGDVVERTVLMNLGDTVELKRQCDTRSRRSLVERSAKRACSTVAVRSLKRAQSCYAFIDIHTGADEKYARQCIHHLLLCHGEAVKLFREKHLPGQIGVVVDVWKHYPARPDNADDIVSAMMNNEIEGYGMFLHPLFLGGYSEELTAYMEETGFTPAMEPGDMDTICQKLDFYGLNFYNGLYDNADEQRKAAEGGNFQNRPEQHLEAVYDVLHMLAEDYKIDIPIYITENGVAQDDSPDREAILNDGERIAYVAETLRHVRRAMDDGIDVRGYYLWSLMDNFEWSAGFAARFGLYYTDYEKMELIPKKSAGWYRDVIRNKGFEE